MFRKLFKSKSKPEPKQDRAAEPAPVPEPIPEPIPEPVAAPSPEPDPVAAPEPRPLAVPRSEPEPEPTREPPVAPEVEPVAAPAPEPRPCVLPDPEPAPCPQPQPAMERTPVAAPAPPPKSAPAVDRKPEPRKLFRRDPDKKAKSEAVALDSSPDAITLFEDAAATEEGGKSGWLGRLKLGLGRSSDKLVGGIGDLVNKRHLDDEDLEDLEDLLIGADLGVTAAARTVEALVEAKFDRDATPEQIRAGVATELAKIIEPVARPLTIDCRHRPHVILVCGVNGSGKTTTIGKMAHHLTERGRKVMLAAADTFRAAAVEQLKIWGERASCPVIARDIGADAAGLAFDALTQARAEGYDVLLIDTAGRLQNKQGLMDELQKMVRVLGKMDEAIPHTRLLVLDATVGQNALSQVEVFQKMIAIDGLVVTKLDGTAKGGVVVALADKFGLPVHAIGVGETIEDMRPFTGISYARNLMGLEV